MPTTNTNPVIAPGFDPKPHFIKLKTREGLKDYLPVPWRVVWFRSCYPNGIITTQQVFFDPNQETEEETFAWNEEKRRSEKVIKRAFGFALYHARVETGEGGVGEGSKSEKAAAFADYCEKAETGAIGRALVALGFGTDVAGMDFEEGYRLPIESTASTAPSDVQNGHADTGEAKAKTKEPTPGQIAARIKQLEEAFAKLYPNRAKDEQFWPSLLQNVFEEVPTTYTSEHVTRLEDYYDKCRETILARRATNKAAQVQATAQPTA